MYVAGICGTIVCHSSVVCIRPSGTIEDHASVVLSRCYVMLL